MKLKIEKPICFFDLETTGVDVSKDRIVEISIFKLNPDYSRESKTFLVNPTIPIPKESSSIHGITDEKVKDAPTFEQIAEKVLNFIDNCDVAGFNSNKFDIPVLAEEFLRAEISYDFKKCNCIDVQNIFHKKEQRTLSAAYKFYCGKELENAHSASADTEATLDIFLAQIEKYDDLPLSVKELAEYSSYRTLADYAGFIGYDHNGEEVLNFGKNKGKTLAFLIENDPGYCSWIENADFPLYTKKVISDKRKELLCKNFNGQNL